MNIVIEKNVENHQIILKDLDENKKSILGLKDKIRLISDQILELKTETTDGHAKHKKSDVGDWMLAI